MLSADKIICFNDIFDIFDIHRFIGTRDNKGIDYNLQFCRTEIAHVKMVCIIPLYLSQVEQFRMQREWFI